MAKGHERARWLRRISALVLPAVWLGLLWAASEWVGKGLFGLTGVWAWLVAGLCLLVVVPVVAYLAYLGIVVLLPVITGKRIDWR